MKVEQFYNKNQFIIYGGDAVVSFQSYQSMIANFDKTCQKKLLSGENTASYFSLWATKKIE